jgi:hypothetical protein
MSELPSVRFLPSFVDPKKKVNFEAAAGMASNLFADFVGIKWTAKRFGVLGGTKEACIFVD